jgi:GYF domain 2
MANYTVIGGDGKEYGPITDADVRRWVAEGRLNAQALAKAESDAEYRPLATFPEFADVFGPTAPAPVIAPVLPTGGSDRQAALDKVRVPAIGLMISAIVGIVFLIIELFFPAFLMRTMLQPFVNILQQQGDNPQAQQLIQQMNSATVGPIGIGSVIFQLIIAILILIGATKMIKLRSYEFSFAAAILAVIPCCANSCCGWLPLGLIFGIWAIVVLRNVKPHFS